MASSTAREELQHLNIQIATARNELKNLRQQITNLKHSYKRDVNDIIGRLSGDTEASVAASSSVSCQCEFSNWKSIGVINTWFPGKRGVPRQAVLCPDAEGVLTLSPSTINNPAYSLSGLEEFSHIWLLYYFHETDSSHIRTKVAPPRLDGARIGVFATRSPHRPCPIGLSLCKINRIEGNKLYFSGVDMVDGTPVLDIKPYIPQYDNPNQSPERAQANGNIVEPLTRERLVEGGSGAVSPLIPSGDDLEEPAQSDRELSQLMERGLAVGERSEREAPDGEEGPVQIASWISSPATRTLEVLFSERAVCQLSTLPDQASLRATIAQLLEQDPRSTYLRRKRGNQFYTFRIASQLVSVKFEDDTGIVTVTGVQPVESN